VTGSPALWWDESENAFGYKNISGLLVEDTDWIGNSGTTARLTFDSSGGTDYAYFSGCYLGVGTTAPDRLFHSEIADAGTTSIVYPARLSHTTSGTAADLFGVGSEHELEDSAGNMQVASEAVTLWGDAESSYELPLRRWTTYPRGAAGPGYMAFYTYSALTNVSRTVIPNGTGDVTAYFWCRYVITSSGGGGPWTDTKEGIAPGDGPFDLVTDTNSCRLEVNVDGSVTIVSTGVVDTFDISMLMIWI
jgi:hypothetical protein